MRVAHFVQRYSPALGGSEAYFARLSRYLAACGDQVTVFTTTAVELEAFWKASGRCLPAGVADEDGVEVRRYDLFRCPGRNWGLRLLRLFPHRLWQCLTLPCNPIAPGMWRDAGRADVSFDVVHATDHTGHASYETEIALVKLRAELHERTEILQIAENFGAKVTDYGQDSMMLRVYGASEKLDAFIALLRPYGMR